ncbi:MAG: 4-(cytidine 5'-diphospho)-2-C-methyl-D-erythritol kinase [Rhodospirillaceae bacterium]|nr:4-(cytidine 5'-diphospho)-2-C-methyl-D-erythritol kinase [Rhodospirillaceae bacterium]
MTETPVDPSPETVSIHAHAKINLYLHVIGQRDDGYHELDSLVGFTEFSDLLTVAKNANLALDIEGPFAGSLSQNGDNLVLTAAKMLANEAGIQPEAKIILHKNLPVASGIGGGSADAAAALKALNSFWQIGLSEEALAKIGLEIGADVPACLRSKTARMAGIGEQISEIEANLDVGVLLVNPGVPISTPEVFRARRGAFSEAVTGLNWDDKFGLYDLLLGLKNDLQSPAVQLVPEIKSVLEVLQSLKDCRVAKLSGSGATCFGLFDDSGAAKIAEQKIRKSNPSWWVQATYFVCEK